MAFSTLLQLVVAVLIVMVLFSIGFFIYNMELLNAIRNTGTNKRTVPVFKGVLDLGVMPPIANNQVYDTTNPNAPNYLDLTPAYNQLPGAGFSYNFWLYLDYGNAPNKFESGQTMRNQDTGLDQTDYILFLRGDPVAKRYNNICGSLKTDILVKSPLVKLENGWDNLTVEFNTVSSPDAVNESARKKCGTTTSSNWLVVNNHKISVYGLRSGYSATRYDKQWFMVTVVIKDTSPEDPLPIRNKAHCMVYVNGQKELDRYVDGNPENENTQGLASVLKQNTGNLYVGPKVTFTPTGGATPVTTSSPLNTGTPTQANTNKVMMADLTYYNYELDGGAISALFNSGFNKNAAPSSVDPKRMDQSYLDRISVGSSKSQLQYL